MRLGWCALALSLGGALTSACLDPPLIPPPRASAGAPSGGAGTAGAATTTAGRGGAPPIVEGGASGEGGEPDPGVGGVAGGSAGTGGAPSGVTWLALEGERGPASAGPNGELGVDGQFYAYADGCSTIAWEPATRCVTGRTCDAGVDFENWGVAVGFDFKVRGPAPGTKLLWDPRDYGARGLAWRISGSAPGLQVWVLAMDPRFDGECPEDSCNIPGPPDGAPAPALDDLLLFAEMQKDYWGGSGTPYTFDPGLVYSVQFKLPAVNIGVTSFSFCVDALGVVR